MRVLTSAIAASLLVMPSNPGSAEGSENRSTLELDASQGAPVLDAIVKRQAVRFALDPVLGPYAAVNPESAPRLGLSGYPIGNSAASIDGAEIKGKVARFGITIDGRKRMVSAALLGRSHLPAGNGQGYDLAGGFEALPADRVIVWLNRDVEGATEEIVFTRPEGDRERGFPVSLGGMSMRVNFHFANDQSWLDRRAAQSLVTQGEIEPVGEVRTIPVWFGLNMPVQEVRSRGPLEGNGLRLGALQARTAAPLVLPEPDDQVIIVTGQREDKRAPLLLVGAGSLSHCSKMTFERAERRLTLSCRKQEV